jgi:hypothetical protein
MPQLLDALEPPAPVLLRATFPAHPATASHVRQRLREALGERLAPMPSTACSCSRPSW